MKLIEDNADVTGVGCSWCVRRRKMVVMNMASIQVMAMMADGGDNDDDAGLESQECYLSSL